jgi:hypothetical protein
MEIILPSINRCNYPIRYFGIKTRYDTITDSVFINENLIVVASRQDATIYLIEIDIKNRTHKIIDTHICYQNNKYYNPDLISKMNNTICITTFRNDLYMVKIINNKIVFSEVISFDLKYNFHGVCTINDNFIYLTDLKYSGIIIEYSRKNNIENKIILPKFEKKRIKNVIIINNNYIIGLACDGGPHNKPVFYKSYINLYKKNGNNFDFIYGIELDNTHIDSGVYINNTCYITCQDENNYGTLLSFNINNNTFDNLNKIKVNEFPHGITYYNNYIMYTCYSNSSVNIFNI